MREQSVKFIMTLSRLIIGLTFIFSGFVKVIDPVGTGLIMGEYFKIVGFSSGFLALFLGVSAAVLELLLGFSVLIGLRMKISSKVVFAFMVFFTLLTLYLAIFNPITHCGCFGEAIVLTHWQSFVKNLVLLLFVYLLYRYREQYRVLAPALIEWGVLLILAVIIYWLSVHSYKHLPMTDFMNYKADTNLDADRSSVLTFKTTFIYSKDGKKYEFTIDNLPDSTYIFVDSKTVQTGTTDTSADFAVTDRTGEYVTEHFVSHGKSIFIATSPKIERVRGKAADKIKALADSLSLRGVELALLTGSAWDKTDAAIERLGLSAIDVYYADYKMLLTMNRSSIGVVYLSDGRVISKWAWRDAPVKKLDKILDEDAELLAINTRIKEKLSSQFALLFMVLGALLLRYMFCRIFGGGSFGRKSIMFGSGERLSGNKNDLSDNDGEFSDSRDASSGKEVSNDNSSSTDSDDKLFDSGGDASEEDDSSNNEAVSAVKNRTVSIINDIAAAIDDVTDADVFPISDSESIERSALIEQNRDMTCMTTLGLKATAKWYAVPSSPAEIKAILADSRWKEEKNTQSGETPLLLIGSGSNILFGSEFYNGLVMHPAIKDMVIVSDDDEYIYLRVGAGVVWDELVEYCVARGWGGLENLSMIPGCVGASPVQNVGAYGSEAKDTIDNVEFIYIESGEEGRLDNAGCKFGYRDSIFKNELKSKVVVTYVTFHLSKYPIINSNYADLSDHLSKVDNPTISDVREIVTAIRADKLPAPAEIGNAGSFFKNPVVEESVASKLQEQYPSLRTYPAREGFAKFPAAWLIDQCGFKGAKKGNVGVHDKQALVLVAYPGATGEELISFAEEIQAAVMEKFGVSIEPEVQIVR